MAKKIKNQDIQNYFVQDDRVFEIVGANVDANGTVADYSAVKHPPDLLTVIFELFEEMGWLLTKGVLWGLVMAVIFCLWGMYTT